MALAALGTGCMSVKSYVDPALPLVSKSQLVAPSDPKPVQVLFEFRTKGNANAAATNAMRPRVVAVASESGVFAGVSSDSSVPGGLFKFVIDNVPGTDDAVAKGIGTGLTFGLAGSLVTDLYLATASYVNEGRRTEVTLQHALHSTVGNKSGPPGLSAVSMADGVNQVVDQLTWNALKQLADKGAFTE